MKSSCLLSCFTIVAVVTTFFLITSESAQCQSLSEKLSAEDPVQLATQARRDGNIVRGAILFHQGNINCAKCHRASAEKNRIGPDLSRIDKEASDKYIIDSILQPSKEIKKGFETVVVLTMDGETIEGIKVSENDKQIVIRDIQDVDKVISIRKDDVDEINDGIKSSMPDNLADELKSRQQFLDLLRFVLDVKERGPTNDSSTDSSTRRELEPNLEGLVLIQQSNCIACHQKDSNFLPPIAATQPPDLKWSAKHLNPSYIEKFLADPHTTKPGTTMPNVFREMDESERVATAQAITHYLVQKNKNVFKSRTVDENAVKSGFELFHSVGCVACHSPRDAKAVEQSLADSKPLGDLSDKYSVPALAEFLEDPLVVRTSGHMPDMNLTHREAVDISNYLLQSGGRSEGSWKLDQTLADKGKLLFESQDCASCHEPNKNESKETTNQIALSKLNLEKGCLSDDVGNWPDYQFQQADRELIRSALKSGESQLDAQQQIDVTLFAYNCTACHDRRDMGGISVERNPHFKTTNLNLGDQGRIPPTSSGVGAKLNKKWLRDVMVNNRAIRPYMKTRMPQFGEENIGHLFQLFDSTDRLESSSFAKFDDQKEMRKKGLELAGSNGLNCVACHTYKYKLSDTMPAVDLTEMAERLKKDWFYQYMLEPQKFSPNTVMPSFWPSGKAIRTDIEGLPREQIEAIWQYLVDGRQAGTPRGVVREPLEIIVTNEAKMLRRSYPDVGKRGIGVGYPGGVNLVFDAEQMRLAAIWRGKFVDPSGVWRGQGSGTVRPMNRTIKFAKGPNVDDTNNPWEIDDGRPPNHQFKGYSLDKIRQPTFRYAFDNVAIEDFFSPATGTADANTRLRRTLRLASEKGRDGVDFRIAIAQSISSEKNNIFQVGEKLHVRIVSNQTAKIVDNNGQKILVVSLNLQPGQQQILIIEYLWE